MASEHIKNQAFHKWYVKGMSQQEIADEYDVEQSTVSKWCQAVTDDEALQNAIEAERKRVTKASITELRNQLDILHSQLRECQVQKENADTIVKTYEDEDDELAYKEVTNNGNKDLILVPQTYEKQEDTTEMYFRRTEAKGILSDIREVLAELRKVTGAENPDKLEISGKMDHEYAVDESTLEKMEDLGFED